jgi:hypothetical protein
MLRLRRSTDVRETRQSTRRTHTVTGRSQIVSTPGLHWYVAGLGDGATHKGVWLPAGGSVRSWCAIELVPLPIGWPAGADPRAAAHPTRSRSASGAEAGPVKRTRLVVLFDSADKLVRAPVTPGGGSPHGFQSLDRAHSSRYKNKPPCGRPGSRS